MCGIAGICRPGTEEREVDLMLSMLGHRGPDELGTYTNPEIAMGTARLSIIDIAQGQQPMLDQATGVVIAYNGEVFNYVELRDELIQKGHSFRTESDTEVVLRLFLEEGPEFARRLNGQFAVAIWDPRQHRLVLVRDRFGICPMSYHYDGTGLAFASEVKALFTVPWIPKRLDLKAIDQIFSFWVPIAGRTAFAGVNELPPGHLLIFEPGEGVQTRPFWEWEFPDLQEPSTLNYGQAQEALRAALETAVALRLRADIEVGSYLSGGIDSSAIVALGKNLQRDGLRTFGVGFQDRTYDERKYQELVATHCETTHRSVTCGYEDIGGAFGTAVWHAEMPLFRTAPTPLNLLSKSVRDAGIKVVLTGEGADEVLLGYDLFREVKIRRFWARQPTSRLRPQLFKKLYAYLPQFSNPRYANLAIESFRGTLMSESSFYSHELRWANNAANKLYFSSSVRDGLADYDCVEDLESTMPADFFTVGDIDRAQYLELTTLLRGYLLGAQGDRQMMANSVEGRFPYLDNEFVSFAGSLPKKFKIPGLKDKIVLRDAFEKLLPREICHRPKFAYQAPEIRAFFPMDGSRSPLVDEHLTAERIQDVGIFKAPMVSALIRKVASSKLTRLGTRDNMAFVQILSTQTLFHRFVQTDIRRIAEDRVGSLVFKTRVRNGVVAHAA